MKIRAHLAFWKRIYASVVISASLTAVGYAQEKSKPEDPAAKNASAVVSPTVVKLSLGQCLAVAAEKQPTLKAARAMIAAAQSGQKGLEDVGFIGSLFSPELNCRKQQSANGLKAVQAEMSAAEQEITYSVVRNYYSVVYAREQYKLTKDLVTQLDVYLEQVKAIVNSKDGGSKGINKNTEDRLKLARTEATRRRNQAQAGIQQAFAALREAMGMGPNDPLEIADELLPEINAEIRRDAILGYATTRRAEVQLAAIGADVSRIEVMAQWAARLRRKVPTYASGSDIHGIPIPTGSRDSNYRPETLGPRMPTQLVGNRETRAAQATAYAEYAEALQEKTRNLVTLEAENAYQKYWEATENVKESRVAAKTAKELITRLREAQGTKLDENLIVTSEAATAIAYAGLNEALIDQITALANLERITAGGIRVNYPGR